MAASRPAGDRRAQSGRVKAVVDVDGSRFFTGRLSCVLVGNVAKILGGIEVFDGARPDDGFLELGLVTARNPVEWARALARVAQGRADQSPFIEFTRGKRFRIRLDRPLPCELDGGARAEVTKMRIKVHPGSVKICVPG